MDKPRKELKVHIEFQIVLQGWFITIGNQTYGG